MAACPCACRRTSGTRTRGRPDRSSGLPSGSWTSSTPSSRAADEDRRRPDLLHGYARRHGDLRPRSLWRPGPHPSRGRSCGNHDRSVDGSCRSLVPGAGASDAVRGALGSGVGDCGDAVRGSHGPGPGGRPAPLPSQPRPHPVAGADGADASRRERLRRGFAPVRHCSRDASPREALIPRRGRSDHRQRLVGR